MSFHKKQVSLDGLTLFTNILVALDISEVSQRVHVETNDQARAWNAKIQTVYVAQPPQFNALPMNESFGIESTYEMNCVKKKTERRKETRS